MAKFKFEIQACIGMVIDADTVDEARSILVNNPTLYRDDLVGWMFHIRWKDVSNKKEIADGKIIWKNGIKWWCKKSMDYENHTTIMTEYCLTDVNEHPCMECYYSYYIPDVLLDGADMIKNENERLLYEILNEHYPGEWKSDVQILKEKHIGAMQ